MATACVCSTNLEVLDDGSLCVVPGSLGLRERIVFDACGQDQFDPSAFPWLARVNVKVVGGGASGGGVEATTVGTWSEGGGGGGGGYSERLIDIADLGAGPIIVTVGCGGAAPNPGNDGNPGGASSLGGFLSATGGGQGAAGVASDGTANARAGGGNGGIGTGGDINTQGGDGGTGFVTEQTVAKTGWGGGSVLGGTAVGLALNSAGSAGRAYGGGSSGASSFGDQGARASLPGADGVVIIELYG